MIKRIKKGLLIVTTIALTISSLFSLTANTQTPEEKLSKSSWEYHEHKDKMSGEVAGFVLSYSKNELKGMLRNGRVILGYQCGKSFSLLGDGIGFYTEKEECIKDLCRSIQHARIRFDNGSTSDIRFVVLEDNIESMYLDWHGKMYTKKIISSMKRGKKMYLELRIVHFLKGEEQIAEFDLNGFTKALSQCNQ